MFACENEFGQTSVFKQIPALQEKKNMTFSSKKKRQKTMQSFVRYFKFVFL